jgi:hypothetical protein
MGFSPGIQEGWDGAADLGGNSKEVLEVLISHFKLTNKFYKVKIIG